MKTFDEYTIDWFRDLIEQHSSDEEFCAKLFDLITGGDENEDDSQTILDYLEGFDDTEVLIDKLFSEPVEGVISKWDFLKDCFLQAACAEPFETQFGKLEFVNEFIEDMAAEAEGYDSPLSFFLDLTGHGCSSGMVGMLIYNDQCKDLYVKYIDDMESVKEYLEGEFGGPVKNEKKLSHYVFMSWLCYEELGNTIARNLFPETF